MADAAPTTRAEQARRTRARILEVARLLFAGKGYEATSLQDIADEMGLTKPAVYYHYKGKNEILKDLAEPVREASIDLLTRAHGLPLGPERTELLVTGLADLLITHREMARIMAQQPGLREDVTAALGARRLIDGLVMTLFGPEPSPDQRFAVYSGIAVGHAVWALDDIPEEELRGVVERALRRTAAVH